MKIERFEDIQVWQKSRELVKSVYQATSGTQAFKQDFSLKDLRPLRRNQPPGPNFHQIPK